MLSVPLSSLSPRSVITSTCPAGAASIRATIDTLCIAPIPDKHGIVLTVPEEIFPVKCSPLRQPVANIQYSMLTQNQTAYLAARFSRSVPCWLLANAESNFRPPVPPSPP